MSWADIVENSISGSIGEEPNKKNNLAQIEYAKGLLLPRYSHGNDDSVQINILVYNSERDLIPRMVNYIDPLATQIEVESIKAKHSAEYKFRLSMTKHDFIEHIEESLTPSYPLFHGLFDSISNIRLSDPEPKIIFDMNDKIYNIFSNVCNTLFPGKIGLRGPRTIISNKDEIDAWRGALYFNVDNTDEYDFVLIKENHINQFSSNKLIRKPDRFDRTAITNYVNGSIQMRKPSIYTFPRRNIVEVTKINPNAKLPVYATSGSAGADVTIIRFIEEINGVQFYGTGITIQPPAGFYTQLYARSSLAKKGYMLANNVGIIDNDYRGELIVQVIPIDRNNIIPLVLPMVVAQLIVEPMNRFTYTEVQYHSDANTERATGGFGSTDNRPYNK